MNYFLRVLVLACVLGPCVGSKLSLPRVLLPLSKSSPTNFTLKVSSNGCYTWTLSRLDIVQIIPQDLNKKLDCSSEVILMTITKEFIRNTVIVLVEEVTTKEVLRCDVIVDVISSLQIITKTRQLYVEESPEIFEVRAYDKQGNEFSTLEGIQFVWSVSSGNAQDLSSKNDVIRFINFKDSYYEIPSKIHDVDAQVSKEYMVLLEGVKTGTANVSVELGHHEYRSVPPTTVQLNVIANLLIEPADLYILQGDIAHYKLLQVKNGRFIELPLPSNQYSLVIEDETVARQLRPWIIEALKVGGTKLMLSDVNSKMSHKERKTYLPSVNLNVVVPAYMNLVTLPNNNWITVLHQSNTIVAELYDSNNHKIHVGPYTVIKMNIENKFRATETAANGSYVIGYPEATGIVHVRAVFNSVRSNDQRLISFNELHAEADLIVYDPLAISPPEIRIPWDAEESPKLNYPLHVTGGDGLYQWSISDTHIAIVTQAGIVKPKSIGRTKVTVSLPKNPALQASAGVLVQPPSKLVIVRSTIDGEIGSPIFLAVALFYSFETSTGIRKSALFTNCTGFPFEIDIHSGDFYYNSSSHAVTPSDACTTLGIIGKVAGTTSVTVSYRAENQILQDSVTIAAYEPLRVLSPDTGKTVLSVGAQRYVVFEGGPSRSSKGHKVDIDSDKSVIAIEQTYDRINNKRIFLVTCQNLGKGFISLLEKSLVDMDGLSVPVKKQVHIECSNPTAFALSADILDKNSACPIIFQDVNTVLNNKPIIVRISVTNNQGEVFDNATSLEVKWALSDESLGEINFQDAIKLQEDIKPNYKLPLYHYQIITPSSKIGSLIVTARIMNYKKSWLERLSINWDEKTLKIKDLRETLTLKLVDNVRISPPFISLYNYPENVAVFHISHGSGFYNITSDAGKAAQINFSEISKSVEIVPYLPGTFKLKVKDECFNSESVSAEVLILTVSQINVDVQDKVEKGKTIKAYLTLIDSEGNIVSKKDLLNVKLESDTNIVHVNCDTVERSRIICTIRGLELGFANLVFTSGYGESIVRSKSIGIQVYPPLQIFPKNTTLIPGASIQLEAKGGPQPHCVIEFSVSNNIIKIDNAGNVIGKEIGETIVTGNAVEIQANGDKTVYSSSKVVIYVVHLEGIRIQTPITTIKSNAKAPIWVEAIPYQISPLVLASVTPPLSFKWDVSSPDSVALEHIFQDTGVKVSDSDKVSMRLKSLKKGNVVISVNVTTPRSIRNIASDGRHVFFDSITVKVFDELLVSNQDRSPVLLPPVTNYDLKTNKDKLSRVLFANNAHSCGRTSVFDVNNKGVVSTSNVYGVDCLAVTSIEEEEISQNALICVEVLPVKYMMLSVIPELQVDPETSIYGLPKGVRLPFEITYHDNYGRQFASTRNVAALQLSKIDKIRVSEIENNKIYVDLLDYGSTILKLYDEDESLMPDFVRINTVPYIQPDKVKMVVGDVICFYAPAITDEGSICMWNTSNENALAINKWTGLAVAKSEQSNVIVSYQCSNDVKIITTADIYALQKVEIVSNKVENISNNGKRFVVPLRLLNRADNSDIDEKIKQFSKNCPKSDSAFYPYECEIKFNEGFTAFDISSVFKTYPHFDITNGHSCVIESASVNTPQLSKIEAKITLKVTWGRYHTVTTIIPFKPAIFFDSEKLVINDEKPTDYIRLVGSSSVLNNVQIVPSNAKFIAVREEVDEIANLAKFAVYVKPAFLKDAHCPSTDLSVTVVSELTNQNVKIPINVNVNAERYAVPSDLSETVSHFMEDHSFKVFVGVIVGLIIYVAAMKIFNRKSVDDARDVTFRSLDMSHNRSHLSDSSPPGLYRYSKPSLEQMQMMYNRSPTKISRRH